MSVLPPDYRQLFEAVPGLYLVLTPDLRIAAVSEAYLAATMTTRDGILGRGLFDVFPDNPDDPSATGVRNLRASLDRVRRDRRPDAMDIQKYDVRRPTSQGGGFEERYWSPVNSPVFDADGEVAYIIHSVQDVTELREMNERVRLEERLRTSESRWRSVIDAAVDGIIVIDALGRIEAFNPAAERLFGYAEREIVGQNVKILMPPPYHEEHDGYLARYQATGEPRIIGTGRDVTGRRRDNSVFPLHLSVGEMWLGGERKFTGILHDLTTRVQLDERLRASEARWRSVVESAVDGIVVIDAQGRIEAFNPAAERLFGYREEDVVGRNVNMLMPAPYQDEHDGYLEHYRATGVPKIIGIGREVTGLRRDGTMFPVHLAVGDMTVNGERKFTGILHDLSARVRLEEQLREQAALAKLGEMAAVIAHEVKNPLAGIRGAVQVIGGRLPADSREAAVMKEIITRIDGLNGLMKDLLLFARPPQPRPGSVDIGTLVTATAGLLSEDPAVAGVRVELHGSAPAIMGDADLLKIVFVNLLVNGAQAMHGQGVIRVSVTSVDRHCQIAFHDSGPGIPADIREKVFTPFFTTKSRGTGLGLPTVKRLVEAHAGSIHIECPPGGGTTVRVHLPA